MEGKKCSLSVFLLAGIFCVVLNSTAQTSFREDLYNAYIKGDMLQWQRILENQIKPGNATFNEKVNYLDGYYGLIGWLLGNEKKKEASAMWEKGSDIIDELLEEHPDDATLLAYKAAFYGFAIGIQRVKAVFLGPKSMYLVNSALETDPENIQANLEKANILYYSPMMVGGDKTKSVEFYQKACRLMQEKNLAHKNWLYLSTCVQLAMVFEKNGEKEKAREIYEQILDIEPRFTWVKDELLPNLLKTEQQ